MPKSCDTPKHQLMDAAEALTKAVTNTITTRSNRVKISVCATFAGFPREINVLPRIDRWSVNAVKYTDIAIAQFMVVESEPITFKNNVRVILNPAAIIICSGNTDDKICRAAEWSRGTSREMYDAMPRGISPKNIAEIDSAK